MVNAKISQILKLMFTAVLLAACADQRGFKPKTQSDLKIAASRTKPKPSTDSGETGIGTTKPADGKQGSAGTPATPGTPAPDKSTASVAPADELIQSTSQMMIEFQEGRSATAKEIANFSANLSADKNLEAAKVITGLSILDITAETKDKAANVGDAPADKGNDFSYKIRANLTLDGKDQVLEASGIVSWTGKLKGFEFTDKNLISGADAVPASAVQIIAYFCPPEQCKTRLLRLMMQITQKDSDKIIYAAFGQDMDQSKLIIRSSIATPFPEFRVPQVKAEAKVEGGSSNAATTATPAAPAASAASDSTATPAGETAFVPQAWKVEDIAKMDGDASGTAAATASTDVNANPATTGAPNVSTTAPAAIAAPAANEPAFVTPNWKVEDIKKALDQDAAAVIGAPGVAPATAANGPNGQPALFNEQAKAFDAASAQLEIGTPAVTTAAAAPGTTVDNSAAAVNTQDQFVDKTKFPNTEENVP